MLEAILAGLFGLIHRKFPERLHLPDAARLVGRSSGAELLSRLRAHDQLVRQRTCLELCLVGRSVPPLPRCRSPCAIPIVELVTGLLFFAIVLWLRPNPRSREAIVSFPRSRSHWSQWTLKSEFSLMNLRKAASY